MRYAKHACFRFRWRCLNRLSASSKHFQTSRSDASSFIQRLLCFEDSPCAAVFVRHQNKGTNVLQAITTWAAAQYHNFSVLSPSTMMRLSQFGTRLMISPRYKWGPSIRNHSRIVNSTTSSLRNRRPSKCMFLLSQITSPAFTSVINVLDLKERLSLRKTAQLSQIPCTIFWQAAISSLHCHTPPRTGGKFQW